MRRMMRVLLIWLTICSLSLSGCRTALDVSEAPEPLPPMPAKPVMRPVRFADAEGGLLIAYDEYRNLERNIIEMRRYIGELEAQIEYYRSLR